MSDTASDSLSIPEPPLRLPTLPQRSSSAQHWQTLAKSTIFIAGLPRSGTTWLAKIFDSHPDILYRHEPDKRVPPNPALSPIDQVARWLAHRGLKATSQRPVFAKSYRSATRSTTRETLARLMGAAARLPAAATLAEDALRLPDLIARDGWTRVRPAIKLVNWDPGEATRALPSTRCVFLLRHPCGQINSTLEGLRQGRFQSGTRTAALDFSRAAPFAAAHGVYTDQFAALPIAAQLAWAWRAFNEPAIETLRTLPNARIVLYEELCNDPMLAAHDLFAFAGLPWDEAAAAFIASSTGGGDTTHDRGGGYYEVFRQTATIPNRWHVTLSKSDQAAIRNVVNESQLARWWFDLRADRIRTRCP